MSRVDELFENVLARGKKKKELWPREYTTILDSSKSFGIQEVPK
jgi:hypothetical protein